MTDVAITTFIIEDGAVGSARCRSCAALITSGTRCDRCKAKQRRAAKKYRQGTRYKETLATYLTSPATLTQRRLYMRTYRTRQKTQKRCYTCTKLAMPGSVFCRYHRDRANKLQVALRGKKRDHYKQLWKAQRARAKARRAASTVTYEMIRRSLCDIEMSRWSTIVSTSSISKNCSAITTLDRLV